MMMNTDYVAYMHIPCGYSSYMQQNMDPCTMMPHYSEHQMDTESGYSDDMFGENDTQDDGSTDNDQLSEFPNKKTSTKQRRAANERERRRMNSINKGFDKLRHRLPGGPIRCEGKKLSKVDTLKKAIAYIRELGTLLEEDDLAPPPKLETPPSVILRQNCGDYQSSVEVTWRRMPEKYSAVFRTPDGRDFARQKDIWMPPTP